MERRDPYECMCTVTVKGTAELDDELSSPGENEKEPKDEGTCSGILIDSRKGLVLTHASLLYPLISKIKVNKLKHLRQSGFVNGNIFTDDIEMTVFLPSKYAADKNVNDTNSKDKTGNYNPATLNCNFEEETAVMSYGASLKSVFECKTLKRTLHRMMPSDTWQFVDSVPKNDSAENAKLGKDEELFYRLLPCFVLFQLKNWAAVESELKIKRGLSNHLGDQVEICATPFGGLNSEVFMNSRSRGIISNMAGPRNVLLLTDARCVPGSEGGGLFSCQGRKRLLTGIIVASLCWKNNEWVGLTMACAISELLGDLEGTLLDMSDSDNSSVIQNYSFDSTISRFISLVSLVQVGNTWGSEVIISPTQKIVLTCSHVLKGSEHVPVKIRVKSEKYCQKYDGKVVYKCPDVQQYDLGVLKIVNAGTDFLRGSTCSFAADVKEGEVVYVIGHAVFGADLDLLPTVTMGIVSKINRIAGTPVMIQTTCAVHAGASGGAVINQQGQLVAIVVCNSKDTISGACYPHVNMCVPITTIKQILRQYLNTGDSSILKGLHVKNKTLQQLWSIGTPVLCDLTSQL